MNVVLMAVYDYADNCRIVHDNLRWRKRNGLTHEVLGSGRSRVFTQTTIKPLPYCFTNDGHRMYHQPHKLFFLALAMTLLIGCTTGGGMGTEYGTGGMEEGVHMGGWGDGYGDSLGRSTNDAGSNALDNDPHYTPTYHNKDFTNDRGFAYYHPATSAKSPDKE